MRLVRSKSYVRSMKAMGFGEKELRSAEEGILLSPLANPLIPGLRGARKARISRPGMGKRGGGRVVYYIMFKPDLLAFLLAYPKNQKDDLTSEDRKAILRAIDVLTTGADL